MNAGIIHYKGEWLSKVYSGYFDKILVDAPCSGLGIIQKKNEVNSWWSKENAEGLGELQLKLLVGAIKMLKTGGEIVYSTCTLTVEENELVINKILKKYPVEIIDIELPVKAHEGFTTCNNQQLLPDLSKAKRILPWENDSDGFFIVKLRKISDTQSPDQVKPGNADFELLAYDNRRIKNYLTKISALYGIDEKRFSDFNYIIKGTDIYFIDKNWNDEHPGLFERIGTRFGTTDKRDDLILHTQAAQVFEKDITSRVFKIEKQDYLKIYLEGGTIKEEMNFTGQCVVKYNNHILGSGVVTPRGIKSRFPRSRRTQEIIKKF
jgi:16S rRNA (cytosine1407-C5)-methyltransferase